MHIRMILGKKKLNGRGCESAFFCFTEVATDSTNLALGTISELLDSSHPASSSSGQVLV